MGIFSNSSPFDADVEKVTPEEDKSSEDWGSMLDICDKVGDSTQNAKDCLRSIIRRLNNPNPHVVLKAITLLDVCVKNCLRVFLLEIASREFEQEYRKILKKTQQQQPKVADHLKLLLKKWADNEFKSNPQLSLIPSLYHRLKQEGVDFSNLPDNPTKSTVSSAQLKDPNVVSSEQEEEDIIKAIELSLRETSLSSGGTNSLYPSASHIGGNKSFSQSNPSKQKTLVKALYDFEAAEDNELTFYTGEIIEVIDNSDKNWWKGVNHRGEGLFPSNFVTDDLSTPGSSELENKADHSGKSKNHVKFSDSVSVSVTHDTPPENLVINEQKIDRLMHLLHEANPTDESADTEEMMKLEDEVNAMGPLIDNELEKVDRKHAQLTQLSSNLVDAFNLYHTLMREPFLAARPRCETTYMPPMSAHHTLPHPHSMMYHSGMNGPYSLPPPGLMNEQYNSNSIPSMVQQPAGVHQQMNQSSHHFVPIATVPQQLDGYHHPSMITSPTASARSFVPSVDPNLMQMQYGMPPNSMHPQQMSQNLYQQMQPPVISQESMIPPPGVAGLQSNPRI